MNCRPGDRALIVGSMCNHANVGRCVVVHNLLAPNDLPENFGPTWWVSAVSGDKLVQTWSNDTVTAEDVIVCLDRHLLRLPPEDPAENFQTDCLLEAGAGA